MIFLPFWQEIRKEDCDSSDKHKKYLYYWRAGSNSLCSWWWFLWWFLRLLFRLEKEKEAKIQEAKREENPLGDDVVLQAETYANNPRSWYGLWKEDLIPLVYLANGNKILFKNLLDPESDYVELDKMHSPKKMLKLIKANSTYGALPRIEKKGLRDCQYNAEVSFENSLINGKKKSLAVLATGSGKTYLACLASYRLLNYTPTDRVLFLVDRNNLAKQTENEFSTFVRTENGMTLSSLYSINRLKKNTISIYNHSLSLE